MTSHLRFGAKFFLLLGLLSTSFRGGAQSPLDVGVHLTPQVRYITSSPADLRQTTIPTVGEDGLAVGFGGGGYLEYEFAPGWSARGGVDFSYKRNHYTVKRTFTETGEVVEGHNRIAYASIEVPVSLVYHFDYLRHDNRYLIGVGTTLNRWNGAPTFRTRFFRKGTVDEPVSVAKHTFTVFGGYEHPVSRAFVLSFEPYLTYVPSEFLLETASRSKIFLESGLSVRLRLDN
ncbi:hypothetical protein CLV84_1257 [Neolewinella xylanilytica]|uniref:Outer membrane protein with beta-barrel domain n=1 Tax=Neolewinella xylanilytica TaxID=1514080 RepID=A0A2S6I9Y7_9BACT|nr:hypothetical protein [Neolewinella xylanilytica]PPK88292.1 hypothetical protein CLV84_1257 [Neolewinella xylanilytica]